jgi:hypothetical protein
MQLENANFGSKYSYKGSKLAERRDDLIGGAHAAHAGENALHAVGVAFGAGAGHGILGKDQLVAALANLSFTAEELARIDGIVGQAGKREPEGGGGLNPHNAQRLPEHPARPTKKKITPTTK